MADTIIPHEAELRELIDKHLGRTEHRTFIDDHLGDSANRTFINDHLSNISDHAAISDLGVAGALYSQSGADAVRGKINEILDVLRDAGLIPPA